MARVVSLNADATVWNLPDKYLREQMIHWWSYWFYIWGPCQERSWNSPSKCWGAIQGATPKKKIPSAQVSLFEFWRFCFTFCILYFVLHCWASVGDCSCRSVTRSTAFINQGTLDLSCHSSLTLRINPPYIKSRGKNTTFLQTVGLYLWRRPFVLIDIYISFSDCRNLQIVLIVKI